MTDTQFTDNAHDTDHDNGDSQSEVDVPSDKRFIRRLMVWHSGAKLGALHQWQPGQLHLPMIEVTTGSSHDQYPAWALTAKTFALFNARRTEALPGFPGTGIGRWARRATTKATQLTMDRLVDALIRAQQLHEVDRQLSGLARLSVTARFSPHWETVLAELAAWNDPTTRDDVRFAWARDFHTLAPMRMSTNGNIER